MPVAGNDKRRLGGLSPTKRIKKKARTAALSFRQKAQLQELEKDLARLSSLKEFELPAPSGPIPFVSTNGHFPPLDAAQLDIPLADDIPHSQGIFEDSGDWEDMDDHDGDAAGPSNKKSNQSQPKPPPDRVIKEFYTWNELLPHLEQPYLRYVEASQGGQTIPDHHYTSAGSNCSCTDRQDCEITCLLSHCKCRHLLAQLLAPHTGIQYISSCGNTGLFYLFMLSARKTQLAIS